QESETRTSHAREVDPDRLFDRAPRHARRTRNPFCRGLDLGETPLSVAGGELPAEGPDEVLGRPVMIGEVPRGEPSIVIGEHGFDGARRIDRTMRAGNLPHPVQDPADAEIGGGLETARGGARPISNPGSKTPPPPPRPAQAP